MARHRLEPIEHFIETSDGWRLAAYRYARKTQRAPILLIHGLGSNRYDVDFPDERISLAKYLYRKGFDVWVLEMRGAGKSQALSPMKRVQSMPLRRMREDSSAMAWVFCLRILRVFLLSSITGWQN